VVALAALDRVNMRKIISFICAVSLGLGCIYALYFIAFEARGYFVWMPVIAAVGLFVSAYWLWEDFVAPYMVSFLGRALTNEAKVLEVRTRTPAQEKGHRLGIFITVIAALVLVFGLSTDRSTIAGLGFMGMLFGYCLARLWYWVRSA
jgi:hypothetical protein